MPGKDATVSHDGTGKAVVHEPMHKVRGVTHPLVRNAAGEFSVQAKFTIDLGIEWAIRLSEQPLTPVSVLFSDQFRFFASTPSGTMVVPHNLHFAHLPESSALHHFASGFGIGFATVL